jgi:hypothetical protein
MKKYIYIIVITFLVVAIGNSVYQQVNKKSAKSVRLECHKNSTVFEKLLKAELLDKLQSDIKNGNLKVTIDTERSKYMESKLFDFISKEKIEQDVQKLLNKNSLTTDDPISSVNILVYENDKDDPGKKTKKSKLYAGYLVFSFKVDKSLVYKLQIDFFDHEGKDIEETLKCGFKSLLTLKGHS